MPTRRTRRRACFDCAPDVKPAAAAPDAAPGATWRPASLGDAPVEIFAEPPNGKPFAVLLDAWLRPDQSGLRCAIVGGPDEPASTTIAAALLDEPGLVRQRLIVRSGDPETDRLLADLAPALLALVQDLTDRQRVVGRLLLVDGPARRDR